MIPYMKSNCFLRLIHSLHLFAGFFKHHGIPKQPMHRAVMPLSLFVICLMIISTQVHEAQIQPFQVTDTGVSKTIAVSHTGEFMVTWTRGVPGAGNPLPIYSPFSQYGRVFNSDGTPKSSEFKISDDGTHTLVKTDERGNYTCFWPSSGFSRRIFMRRYDANGVARTSAESIITSGNTTTFDADMMPDGRFVVAWSENDGSIFNGSSIVYAQKFDSRGRKEGSVIRVTPEDNESPSMVSVSMDEEGGFAIAWLLRTFPPFPAIEKHIALKVATFDADGNALTTQVAMEERIEGIHEHLPPVIKKTSKDGWIVLTTHTERLIGPEVLVAKIEGAYQKTADAPMQHLSLPVSTSYGGINGFNLARTQDGRMVLNVAGLSSEPDVPHYAIFEDSLPLLADFHPIQEESIPSLNPMLITSIAAHPEGTFIYTATYYPPGFPDNAYYAVKAGVIRPPSENQNTAPTPFLNWNSSGKLDLNFESDEGKTYQLVRGSQLDSMKESELIEGTGTTVTLTISPEQSTEFFSIIQKE
jgi:hypothetical protein